jgi:hypothetical protein
VIRKNDEEGGLYPSSYQAFGIVTNFSTVVLSAVRSDNDLAPLDAENSATNLRNETKSILVMASWLLLVILGILDGGF